MFNFPWTNFHELNLDWILSVVKEAKEVFDDGRSDIDYAVSTADEAKEIATQAAEATIPDNSVSTAKIQDYAVNAIKLSNYSVTEAKLQNAAVTTAKIADSAVNTSKLADNAVTTAKLADGAVTNSKLTTVAVDHGGTGATDAVEAIHNLGATLIITARPSETAKGDAIHSALANAHTIMRTGEAAVLCVSISSTWYCGLVWCATAQVIFGRVYQPNSNGGFYFRDSSADTTASTTDFT